jgi:DNA repair ATPase RecN
VLLVLLNSFLFSQNQSYADPMTFFVDEQRTSRESEDIKEILNYSNFIIHLKIDQLYHTYKQKEFDFLINSNDKNALMLSLILIIPDTDFYDNDRALSILERYVIKNQNSRDNTRNLAILISSLIHRMQNEAMDNKGKVKEITSEKNQVLADLETAKKEMKVLQEFKKKYEDSKKEITSKSTQFLEQQKKIDALQKELKAEKKKVSELHEKIEQIKMIEEILKNRKDKKGPET